MVKIFLSYIVFFVLLAQQTAANEIITELYNQQIQNFHGKKWEVLFANALFYRNSFLNNPENIKKNFNHKLLMMEAYALAAHCQYTILKELQTEIEKYQHYLKEEDRPYHDELIKDFVFLADYQKIKKLEEKIDRQKINNPQTAKDHKYAWIWPSSIENIKKEQGSFSEYLVYLENKCEK